MPESGPKTKLAAYAWIAVAAVAAFELIGQRVVVAEVPTADSWQEAAEYVRARFADGDRLTAAPVWVDPIVRAQLGDLLTLTTAAQGDFDGNGTLWELSIRGASHRADPPELEERFGSVMVRAWSMTEPSVVYDFVEHVPDAEVTWLRADGPHECPWGEHGRGPGGLSRGPLPPLSRFACDRTKPWLWVGPTVMADLALRPRCCIWNHPAGPEPVAVSFQGVPLGDSLVVEGGLDYTNDRRTGRSPVRLRVFVDDQPLGELRHRDRDGFVKVELDTGRFRGGEHDVRFEVTTPSPHARTFCWSASTRQEAAP